MAAFNYVFPWSIGEQIWTIERDEETGDIYIVPVLVEQYELDEYACSVMVRYATGEMETIEISNEKTLDCKKADNLLFSTQEEAENFVKRGAE